MADGKIDLKDYPRPGQPKTAATKANSQFYSDYRATFSAFKYWISRVENCISVKGEYFERLK